MHGNSHQQRRRVRHRILQTEQLERRELLAGDLSLGHGPALPLSGNTCEVPAQIAASGINSLSEGYQQLTQQGPQPASVQRGAQRAAQRPVQPTPLPSDSLSDTEIKSLIHMREEEKLARDVYLTLARTWENAAVFTNIAAAESQHMESVKTLIDRYGLSDPVTNDGIGKFTNPEFRQLYVSLVADGSESLLEAYKVGALIEELDIQDLQNAIEDTTHSDVARVYENLMRGSENHLRAFNAQIEALGDSYDAQYLSQDEYDTIADSARETGTNRVNRMASEPLRQPAQDGAVTQRSNARSAGNRIQIPVLTTAQLHDRVFDELGRLGRRWGASELRIGSREQ